MVMDLIQVGDAFLVVAEFSGAMEGSIACFGVVVSVVAGKDSALVVFDGSGRFDQYVSVPLTLIASGKELLSKITVGGNNNGHERQRLPRSRET